VEALLPEMVRRAAAVSTCQLPEDGGAARRDPARQGRDVRESPAGRQARAAAADKYNDWGFNSFFRTFAVYPDKK
jgi:hypothetical protein